MFAWVWSRLNIFAEQEKFANKDDKAREIFAWFDALRDRPVYADYRNKFGTSSNIVEYENFVWLFNNRMLTLSTIKGNI